MSKLVYLAGPITGTAYGECTDWRVKVRNQLDAVGITGLSPMRAKHYLVNETQIKGNMDASYGALSPLSSNKGVITRDRWDATRCDLVLVNFLGSRIVSIGTVMEIAWADAARIPIVCAVADGDIHYEHGMIREAIGFRTATLEDAVQLVKAILL